MPEGAEAESFYRRLAEHAGLPFLDAAMLRGQAVPALSPWTARSFRVVPVASSADALTVAVADPRTVDVAALKALCGRDVNVAVATPAAVQAALDTLFGPPEARHVEPEAAAYPARASLAETRRAEDLARRSNLPFVELEPPPSGADPVNTAAAQLVSRETCLRYRALPISAHDDEITIATDDPHDRLVLDVLGVLTNARPRIVVCSSSALTRAIERVFGNVDPVPLPGLAPPRPDTPRRLGDLLLAAGLVTPGQLAEALGLQARTGDRLGQVLLHMGAVHEDHVASALADQLRLPRLDVSSFEPDPIALSLVPEPLARRHRFAPLAIRDHVLYLAMSDPLDDYGLARLREHTDLPIRVVVAPRTSVERLLQRLYRTKYVELATLDLLNRTPEESAYHRTTWAQRVVGAVVLLVAGLSALHAPIATAIAFNIGSVVFYTSFSLYKFALIGRALRHDLELPVTTRDLARLDPRTLPVYTILVPLYREAAVVGKLVDSIAHLDYPQTRLDIKLIVEEDDEETIARLRELRLPPHFKLVVVPDALPKTKPKACNYGLIQAEGTYVVIFDAEDRPEPDQLKKIVYAFERAEDRIVCIQCKLNYYNRTQNVLTRWFTTEYSHWFDLLMPGLDASDAPIPLGGTSNHFIREKLIELGAWDPYNVTEDADLGVRLHKAGYKTAIVDSTTYEEANSDLYNWIRQRSRWVKGYMQTWLVHMRHPYRFYCAVGLRSFMSFQFIVGGTFVSFLLNPVYWLLTTVWIMTEAGVIRELFPGVVYFAAALGLFVGNFVFTYINVAGCMRRGYYDLVKFALLSPLYWALMSVGAYKGLWQLFVRPHYWEKTVHGLDEPTRDELPAVIRSAIA